jgi:hypothetical protein
VSTHKPTDEEIAAFIDKNLSMAGSLMHFDEDAHYAGDENPLRQGVDVYTCAKCESLTATPSSHAKLHLIRKAKMKAAQELRIERWYP